MLQHRLLSGLLLAACLPAQADAALADLCTALAPALVGKLTPGKALPLPKAELLARIVAAAPGKPTLDGAAVWRVDHAWPEEDPDEARLVRLPVGDDSGRQVVLIGARDGKCRGGGVLDGKGKLVSTWNSFANQFAGKALPRLDAAVTRTTAARLIAAAENGKDAPAKATAALVDLHRQMLRQAAASGAVLDALEQGKAPPAAQVEAMRAAYRAMAARSADLAPTLGSAAGEYAAVLKTAIAGLDALPGATDAGKRKAELQNLKRDCRNCHQLNSDKWKGDLEDFAYNERLRLGLGERVFLVGYDVITDGVDGTDAQLLADACYRAALVIGCSLE